MVKTQQVTHETSASVEQCLSSSDKNLNNISFDSTFRRFIQYLQVLLGYFRLYQILWWLVILTRLTPHITTLGTTMHLRVRHWIFGYDITTPGTTLQHTA